MIQPTDDSVDLNALRTFVPPPLAQRRLILGRFATLVEGAAEDLARAITAATAKPIALSRIEVARGLGTIRGTAQAMASLEPRSVDLGSGARGEIHRVPLGPVLAVTPFNFPLNLSLHKLCPAIAAGCPVIWKPSPLAPGVAEATLELLRRAGAPPGMVTVRQLSNDEVAGLCADPRLAVMSFTGSVPVGKQLRRLATSARCLLELGGNAAVILGEDIAQPAMAAIADTVACGATANAGQVCISVQRILIPETPALSVAWRDALVAAFARVPTGDPWDERTVCGPVIDERAKARIDGVLDAYRAAGGRVLAGGRWNGLVLEPTLVDGVPAAHPQVRDSEVFAPIATLHAYRDLDHALAIADDTPFGLQAGMFSADRAAIATAFERLSVGTLVVNDVPGRRDDRLPYGGMKDSGTGREGTMATLLDYTQEKVVYFPNG